MTIKEEIQIEEYKRTFAEAYKQGFIDAMSVCKTEPQYDFGDFADRVWEIAYERGKREAFEQTEPQTERSE